MAEAPDCRSAQAILQRALTGIPVSDQELERALAHVAACAECGAPVDLAPTAACMEVEEDLPNAAQVVRNGEALARRLPDLARHLETCARCKAILAELVLEPEELAELAEVEVEPSELFERALTAALAEPEPIVRRRAAERLGSLERPGAAALSALAEAAADDRDAQVRAAALRALDELDDAVSIPERLIEAWSAAPGEAAPFIAGVLARLTGEGPPARPGVIELVGSAGRAGEEVTLSSKEGAGGRLRAEQSELWLELHRLPSGFEKTKPMVALPGALAEDAPAITWSGERPGLVEARTPVAGGSVDVRLGEVGAAPEAQKLFERVYLLQPEPGTKQTS